jgi:hypothetical protein
LLENGQLFKTNTDGVTTEIEGTKSKIAKGYFNNLRTLKLDQMDFNHPGNIYQFVEFVDGEKKSKVIWGDKNHPIDSPIQDLYLQLTQLVRER